MAETETFQSWAIVELMGHTKIAGLVTEQALAGGAFLRVDVPGTRNEWVMTKLYGASAVYCITPVTEDLARRAAQAITAPRPVTRWELPVLKDTEGRAADPPADDYRYDQDIDEADELDDDGD